MIRTTISYRAQRSLLPNHVEGSVYVIDVDLQDAVLAPAHLLQRPASLGGGVEPVYLRSDRNWQLTFAPARGAELEVLREFAHSIESGQLFKLWLYGTEGEPLYLRYLDTGSIERAFARVTGADTDWMELALTAVEAVDGTTNPDLSESVDPYGPSPENPGGSPGGDLDLTDSDVIMSASAVLNRRTDAGIGVIRTPDGHDAVSGIVSYSGQAFRAIVCELSRNDGGGTNPLSARIHGKSPSGSAITEDITLAPATMYKVGSTDFGEVSGVSILQSPGGGDSFYCVGTRRVLLQGNSGFETADFRGAIATRLQATVSASPKELNGPLAEWANPTGPIGYAAAGIEDAIHFISRDANNTACTLQLNGTPSNEELTLGTGVQRIDGTVEFTGLTEVIVEAATPTVPFVSVGLKYRGPSPV